MINNELAGSLNPKKTGVFFVVANNLYIMWIHKKHDFVMKI